MATARAHDGSEVYLEVHGQGPAMMLFNAHPCPPEHPAQGQLIAFRDAMLTALTGRYRVVLPAYPGTPKAGLTPEAVTRDLLAIADAAGVDRFAFWGHSWGAVIGLQLALASDRVSALALSGFPPLDGHRAAAGGPTSAKAPRDVGHRCYLSTVRAEGGMPVGKRDRLKNQTTGGTRQRPAAGSTSRAGDSSGWNAAGAGRRCVRFLDAARSPHPALAPVLLGIHLGHADDVERAVADLDPLQAEQRRALLAIGTGLSHQQWHAEMTALRTEVLARLALGDERERHRLLERRHQLLATGRAYPAASEAFVISPQMHNVVMAAAMTLHRDDLWTPDPHALAPAPAGMLMLPVSVGNNDNVEAPMTVLGWRPHDGPVLPGYTPRRGMWVEGWAQRTDIDHLPLWHYAASTARALNQPSPLGIPVSQGWIIDDTAGEDERDALAGNNGFQQELQDQRRERSAVYDPQGTNPTSFSVSAYLFAFWRLCAQRLTQTSTETIPISSKGKPTHRRAHPAPETPPLDRVRIVHLRASTIRTHEDPNTEPETEHEADSGAGPEAESGAESWAAPSRYHHRWPVRMHKVRQWFPAEQTHHVIFRGPYIKSPDGAPLLTGPRAQAIT